MDAIQEFSEKLAMLINESRLPGPIVKLALQNAILQLQILGLQETVKAMQGEVEKPEGTE
jgi:hypothetical protein